MSDDDKLVPVPFVSENNDGKEGLIIYWCPERAINWVRKDGVHDFTEGHASDTAAFVTWAFPDGTTWVSPSRRNKATEAAVERQQIEAWAGGELTDDDYERICKAIPNSSIPEAVETIAAHL